MTFTYTQEIAVFIQALRDTGYSWAAIEDEFEKEYGERKNHDALRKGIQRYLIASLQEAEAEEEEEDLPPPSLVRIGDPLPEYLIYKPRTHTPGTAAKRGTALLIPDVHAPYYCQRSYSTMLEVAKDIPDLKEIVILGDFGDFYAVSSYGKHPEFSTILVKEINLVRQLLEQLAELFPDAKRVFICGNHEHRLTRYVCDKCPELFGLIDVPGLLCLDKLGYEYVHYSVDQKYRVMGSKLFARHEPIGGGIHAAHATVTKAGCSVVYAHNHRVQQDRKVFLNGDEFLACSLGWMGDKTHQVFGYLKNHAQWQTAFGTADILEDGTFFINTHHIINYTTAYRGKIYRG